MSTLNAWRKRRRIVRNHREIDRAIAQAPSPSMREELLVLRNSNQQIFR